VAAAGSMDDDDLSRLVGQVQEGVRHPGREVGEAGLLAVLDVVSGLDLVAAS
jgi:hypothetical protein